MGDHEFVARLENVEWESHAGQEHDVEREERDAGLLHRWPREILPQGLKPLRSEDFSARLPFDFAQAKKPCPDENLARQLFSAAPSVLLGTTFAMP
jgi:hypothetical protein